MNLRKTLRVARWEVTRSTGRVERRTALALAATLVVLALLVPTLAASGASPGEGIYRVGVAESSPYHDAVAEDPSLRAVPPDEVAYAHGEIEVLVQGIGFTYQPTERGRAAMDAFRSAVADRNDRVMARESDQAAAFPVRVSLRYAEQNRALVSPGGDGSDTGDGGAGDGSSGDGGAGDGSSGDGSGDGDSSGDAAGGSAGGGASDALPSGGLLGTGPQSGTPAGITPPFPLRSLVLAFAFLLPLNVVTQAYGSSVIEERIGRRGELLLVAPVSRFDVVAGKTLPYLVGSLAITAGIAALVGGGVVSVAAVAPVALLLLAITFVAGMFARSFKELSFVTVTASVSVMTYAFVPAVFTDVHPVAAISPLSIVVADLQGGAVGAGEFLFATGPMTLAAGALFALGVGVYREEDMFAQRAPPAKALDALAAQLTSRRRVALWSALFVPFVLVAELLAIAVLFVAPLDLSLPALLVVVAVVEEVAKSVHVYAGFERARFDRGVTSALVLGALAGLGFFVGEKLGLVVQLVGLPNLELGRAAFAAASVDDPVVLVALLLAPLALHVGTATLSALGARRSTRAYLLALAGAVVIHVGYNLTVVSRLV
jgi:ABC-type Na+ efflux pump permease subunit